MSISLNFDPVIGDLRLAWMVITCLLATVLLAALLETEEITPANQKSLK